MIVFLYECSVDGSCADTAWAELYSGRDIKVNRLEYVINDRKTLHQLRILPCIRYVIWMNSKRSLYIADKDGENL